MRPPPDDINLFMAHEMWHCYQGAELGLDRFWFSRGGDWVVEGEATWVGNILYPGADIASLFWPGYLTTPGKNLFRRTYDAVGFYSQLDRAGLDVWHLLLPMLKEKGNDASFATAGGTSDQFLDQWASGYQRDPSRGEAWQILGPGSTNEKPTPTGLTVPKSGSVPVSAPAHAAALYKVGSAAEVLTVTASGHARISDGLGHDYLVEGPSSFCQKDGGCECPRTREDRSCPSSRSTLRQPWH